ncbi:LPS export ABC transporter periplasmic protein LptC [Ramlibacter algicola]|uniref:LPS export ABC transporter periplasmic protein LptC n=1 Tax=Ramlibacter algicola TaxID=2795217 RepID=A0A934PYD2_9BURK|nr:LPS export ABC transporter periplasmic protein LptC [Ramlibacter algicola]
MGLLALGTYWLARNTPTFLGGSDTQRPVTHDPDYFMRGFQVRTFDVNGRLKTEVYGTEARHYPDTDTMEIDQPRIRSYDERGAVTVATANRGLSNADASEVQLMGNAVVVREPVPGTTIPRMEFRGEFLHAYMNTERVKSHKPVTLIRGNDVFTADQMDYDNLDRVMQLGGRVRGRLVPDRAKP